jgi:hypothetical protein
MERHGAKSLIRVFDDLMESEGCYSLPDHVIEHLKTPGLDRCQTIADEIERCVGVPNPVKVALTDLTGINWNDFFDSSRSVQGMYIDLVEYYCRSTSRSITAPEFIERLLMHSAELLLVQKDDGELYS